VACCNVLQKQEGCREKSPLKAGGARLGDDRIKNAHTNARILGGGKKENREKVVFGDVVGRKQSAQEAGQD